MDDSVYRSAATSALGYSGLLESRAPRYSYALGFDERRRTGYLDEGMVGAFGGQSMSPNHRDLYGYDGEGRWGSEELIRRYVAHVFVGSFRSLIS